MGNINVKEYHRTSFAKGFIIWRLQVEISVWKPPSLLQASCEFPWPLKTNAGIIPQIRL
jgi:hypothetical protein